MSMTSVSIK